MLKKRTNIWCIRVLVLILAVFTSCSKDDPFGCFRNTGPITREKRETGPFTMIVLRNNLNLILTRDSVCEVVVEAGKNLQDKIFTTVSRGILEIKNENACNWMRSYDKPLNVYVRVSDLDSLAYRASGDVKSTNPIITDSLKVDVWEGGGSIDLEVDVIKSWFRIHEGTAGITARGHTTVNFIYANAYGPVDCLGLETKFTYMNNSGTNHCYVNASYVLEVTIENTGNIYYMGDPDHIKTDISGEGKLIKLD